MSADISADTKLEAAFVRSIEAKGDYGEDWDGLTVLGRLIARNIDEAGTVDSQEQRKALNLAHYFLNVWDRLGLPSHAEGGAGAGEDSGKGAPKDPKFANAKKTVLDLMRAQKDGA